jgi:2-hydroxy-6-oxonona-2,4-dienedioate hydrolase
MAQDIVALEKSRARSRADRFRQVEAAVWSRYGLTPSERYVNVASPPLRLRVLEIGHGRPILLVHGTIGPAAWASLVAAMGAAGRFIVLERPGWGGSDPLDYGRHADYRALAADLLAGVLDGLGIERATVISGSIGDVWALSLAERQPERVERVALLGGGPLLARLRPPSMIRAIASPLGALIVRLPMSEARTRSILADSGHAPSVADGRIAGELIDYRVSVSNDTPAMRHERAMIRQVVRGSGWRPDMPFDEPALGRIAAPALMVAGTNDNIGDPDTWRAFMSAMPNGRLELIDGAGHMPWFDALDDVAGHVRRFLAGA